MRCRFFGLLGLLSCFCVAWAGSAAAADREDLAFFENKIRPLLMAKCGECHGTGQKIKGGLRLTSREAILKGGDNGPAAIVGKPDESLLIDVLNYVDEPKMPPKGKLPDQDRELLSRWIKMGLPWPDEKEMGSTQNVAQKPTNSAKRDTGPLWSLQQVRVVAPRPIKHPELAPTTIDRYLQGEIEKQGIPLAPKADRRTLIRRVSYDLTGLPPTSDEVDQFLQDQTPDAFAKLVDRLLASPRYGEKWGRHWLDLVRYADSRDARGLGSASDILESWRYRDYVVAAFNRDLPYDRFIREQVAGDLLQPASPDEVDLDALVATGLLTIGEWGTGDADKEKMMADIVADQVDVVGRAFLGLTLACARCHDHKFDPITQDDYYGLAGIFFSTHILPDPGAKTAGSDMLRTPLASKSAIARAERYRTQLADLTKKREALATNATEAFAREESRKLADYVLAAWDHSAGANASPSIDALATERRLNSGVLRRWIASLGLGNQGTPLTRPIDQLLGNAGIQAWAGPEDTPSVSTNQNKVPVQILTFTLPPRSVNLHPAPTRPVALVWTAPATLTVQIKGGISDADPACGDGVGWRIEQRHGGLWATLAEGEIGNGASAEFSGAATGKKLESIVVQPGDRLRLAILPKSGHACDTTTVRWQLVSKGETWDVTSDLVPDLLAKGKGNPHRDQKDRADVWTAVEINQASPAVSLGDLTAFEQWKAAIAKPPVDHTLIQDAAKAMAAELASDRAKPLLSRLIAPGGPFRVEAGELPADAASVLAPIDVELNTLRSNPPAPIPVGLVAQDGGVPNSKYIGIHDSPIHIRGEYARLGKLVPRHFPVVLAGDRQPPLTKTASGRKELANWLSLPSNPLTARVLVNRIWQFHFGEGIVRTPSNFGKLGERPTHPALLDYLADRFVASGWSMKAMHREILLSAAYQRSSKATPEARKVDPGNIWLGRMPRRRLTSEELRDTLLFASGQLDLKGGGPADRDFNVPRRTLYQITIRSDRSSFGPLFDAADSTALIDTRTVSTVATQALFLLNHPFVLGQSEKLADRLMREAPSTEARIQLAYRLLFGCLPREDEVKVAVELLGQEGGTNQRAAWVAYAQVMLCTNEIMFVD